ncbi:hypothetical protein Hanom_Chr03g00270801 [Helianthus anomalus]
MALTWATGSVLGVLTRRNERENELYLAANAYGGLGHRPGQKTLISISFFHFYVFSSILGILFLGLCLARYLFWTHFEFLSLFICPFSE